MDPALRAAATGMRAQQTRTEVIANNLANVNTTGFKRSRAHFEDLLYQTVQGSTSVGAPDAGTTPAIQVGRGVRLSAVQRLHAQGAHREHRPPARPRHRGRGLLPGADARRPGRLHPRRQLHRLRRGDAGDAGRLHRGAGRQDPRATPPRSPSRAPGIVTAQAADGTDATEIGRIEMARFANPSGLLAAGREPLPADRRLRRAGARLPAGGRDGPPAAGRASRPATSRSCRRWST